MVFSSRFLSVQPVITASQVFAELVFSQQVAYTREE
jgi:hypothetical protein